MRIARNATLEAVRYDIRGRVFEASKQLEKEGKSIIRLNIGNPAPFGFRPEPALVAAAQAALPEAQGYCDSQGIGQAREAIVGYYAKRGVEGLQAEDVFVGNGVSELIQVALWALLNRDEEVLVPSPDYPLWSSAVTLAGGKPVYYRCEESAGWQPDAGHIRSLVGPKTRAVVLINPNNPTGAVYSEETLREVIGVAEEHGLVVFSDEIYDRIVYNGHRHTTTAALSDGTLFVTFGGLSKNALAAGMRVGWMALSGKREAAQGYFDGLLTLAGMRLCSNVAAQYAVAPALASDAQIGALTAPGGRLYEQTMGAYRRLAGLPGVSCAEPKGAFYCFPKLDRRMYALDDDAQFALDLLVEKQVLLVQGTGFNWPEPDHFRVVCLPEAALLDEALDRFAAFLVERRERAAVGV